MTYFDILNNDVTLNIASFLNPVDILSMSKIISPDLDTSLKLMGLMVKNQIQLDKIKKKIIRNCDICINNGMGMEFPCRECKIVVCDHTGWAVMEFKPESGSWSTIGIVPVVLQNQILIFALHIVDIVDTDKWCECKCISCGYMVCVNCVSTLKCDSCHTNVICTSCVDMIDSSVKKN